jgi:hypothetical protein
MKRTDEEWEALPEAGKAAWFGALAESLKQARVREEAKQEPDNHVLLSLVGAILGAERAQREHERKALAK